MNELLFHPIASVLPMMPNSEIKELAEDIKTNGQREPIILLDDMVLDGRNRYEACKIAGTNPRYEMFTGENPIAYVLSLNVKRRHLTASQKAAVAVEAEPFFAEEAKQRMEKGRPKEGKGKIPYLDKGQARDQAAAAVGGVDGTYVSRAKAIKRDDPEMFEKVKTGNKTISQAKKEIKKERDTKELKAAQKNVTDEGRKKLSSVCVIKNCSMLELLSSAVSPDCIITDPPYPKEFLPLYEELAKVSKKIPLIAVMCGQSYLPQIIHTMSKHLKYRWMLAYLTPGGQAVQLWESKVNTFWKPVLLFGESAEWIGDVCKSETNDNDKRFHGWGQSESGMGDLINRLTKPGQLICDPFVGGGTTAIVSLRLGRKFIGCDIDKESCEKTIQRCEYEFARS